ncbi:hypothetical protein [Kitasatospora sp. NPDC056531]|uniref:hypothetical protein n=1 Tax=Kitasatospora sp. NPDC056531 TaxID=3345856 RepID=UPI0036BB2289
MSGTKDVHFPPVANGMDYLANVMDHLGGTPHPRDLKYAVLHLQAATEVLLKARLVQHDWRQVWMKPQDADQAAYERGDFQSCGIDDVIKRLRQQTDVDIPPAVKSEITMLAKQRNRLQHFGLTETALAIEARTATVLDFLLDFVQRYLRPGLDGDEAVHVDQEMEEVRDALIGIKALVEARMKRIEPELRAAADRTVQCPDCGRTAMLATGEDAVECLLCGKIWEPEEAAGDYADMVLGMSWYDAIKEGGPDPVFTCPKCDLEAVVRGTHLAATPDQDDDFCFNCAQSLAGMFACADGCGTLTDSDIGLCYDCTERRLERF